MKLLVDIGRQRVYNCTIEPQPAETQMKISSSDLIAHKIIGEATKYGWKVFVRGSILTIHKNFTPGDNAAYCDADSEYYGILDLLKSTSAGSVWGTTGDGIGGHVGLTGGYYTVNKSGGNKRVLNALSKMLNDYNL